MIESTNPHARNLKVISIAYILHWWLELGPSKSGELNLTFISYTINNAAPLPFISFLLLIYFSWRFYLTLDGSLTRSFITGLETDLSKNVKINDEFKIELDKIKSETLTTRPELIEPEFKVSRFSFRRGDGKLGQSYIAYTVFHHNRIRGSREGFSESEPITIKTLILKRKPRTIWAITKQFIKTAKIELINRETSPDKIIPFTLTFIAYLIALNSLWLSYAAPWLGSL